MIFGKLQLIRKNRGLTLEELAENYQYQGKLWQNGNRGRYILRLLILFRSAIYWMPEVRKCSARYCFGVFPVFFRKTDVK